MLTLISSFIVLCLIAMLLEGNKNISILVTILVLMCVLFLVSIGAIPSFEEMFIIAFILRMTTIGIYLLIVK